MRVIGEVGKQGTQQGSPWYATIPRPQHAPQRLAAKPSTAAFIRKRQAPAADPIGLSVDDGPAHGTGPGDDNTAVMFAMCANARSVRIGRDDGLVERVLLILSRGEVPWLAGAGQSEARYRSPQSRLRQFASIEALPNRFEHRRKARAETEAEICRSADSLAQDLPRQRTQTRPTMGSAAVYTQKQQVFIHCRISQN